MKFLQALTLALIVGFMNTTPEAAKAQQGSGCYTDVPNSCGSTELVCCGDGEGGGTCYYSCPTGQGVKK